MNNSEIAGLIGSIIIIIIPLIVFVIIGIILFLLQKQKSIVLKDSKKLQWVSELNNRYCFYSIQPILYLTNRCSSKREFDKTEPNDILCLSIVQNLESYNGLIQAIQYNINNYNSYFIEYNKILTSQSLQEQNLYNTYKYFESIEKKLCAEKLLSPIVSIAIHIEKTYISPKGNNSYCAQYNLNTNDLIGCYNNVLLALEYKESAKYQRELMSDSLRYDVLKRDGFRCVICGASQQDGVKLHVDHIRPVSKGGKTEFSNLRTLCDRCNLGKSDKYDPYGQN